MLDNELVDTYDMKEYAMLAAWELNYRINNNFKFIDIKQVNNLLEV